MGRKHWLIVAAAAVVAALVAFFWPKPIQGEARRADAARLMNELMSGRAEVGGPFALFYCPDVCPADLAAIGRALDSLGARAADEAETREVALRYKVFYEKTGDFIDHSAFTFLIDRQGRYVGFFPPGTRPDRMAAMIRDALSAS